MKLDGEEPQPADRSVALPLDGDTCQVNDSSIQPDIPYSKMLQHLLSLQAIAMSVINTLPNHITADLSRYYNHALVSKRAVITDVLRESWRFDLAASLAAVMFSRHHVEHSRATRPQANYRHYMIKLIETLREDVDTPWFDFAVRNARKPTMISMSSLPALNLGGNEERFYVQAISDSWPNKVVSTISGNEGENWIEINAQASRRFVEGVVAGDLGGEIMRIAPAELAFIEGHTIGWISRYEQPLRTVTIIEVDPKAKGELHMDASKRSAMHELTHVEVQTLDKYTINTKMHEDPSFAENFILSRLLTIDQISSPIQLRDDAVDVAEFVHVCGADDGRDKVLGPVDEEALLKSLGSVSAKNKLRSALAIGAKARQVALKQHGKRIRKLNYDLQMGDVHTVIVGQSRMVRCSMDGIYVRTRVPLDSIVVLYVTAGLTVWACHALVTLEGAGSLGEAASLGLALILGISVTYNNLRYNSWSIGQTVRLRRMCVSDEDMRKCMSRADSIRTIAHAGANGTGMDDILTCAYSNATNGSFSVTEPLSLTDAANAGLFLRLSTQLTPLWIDMRGVRAVDITERSYMWHATGEYLDKTYLQLTCSGPDHIGSGNLPM